MIPVLLLAAALSADLRFEHARESLTGTQCRYREYAGGLPTDHYVTTDCATSALSERKADAFPALLRIDGRVIRRVRTADHFQRDYDAETGALLREVPLWFHGKPARVFDPNPVVTTNDPSLRDQNDAASAVPESAYVHVELEEVNPAGPLAGPHVRIIDQQQPFVPPVDSAGSLLFDRGQSGFEDVSAYLHIHRYQNWLQSLGYAGARRVVPYAIEVDTHAAGGTDNSFFIPSATQAGRGTLFFGTGGTDDAEDADLLVHEYGHAIQEWISPGTFIGTFASEARALSEGTSDYWAFSAHYAKRLASGRDAFCLADWDARCWGEEGSSMCGYAPGSDCLRRLDVRRTMAEYEAGDSSGVEHRNGQIWSTALVELFLANVARHGLDEGRRITDTIVVEALFGTPPNPEFGTMAARLLNADRLLFGGAHAATICAAMTARGILATTARGIVVAGGCGGYRPRGELTHFQSVERGLAIPENNPEGITSRVVIDDRRTIEQLFVRVDIRHPSRGDLRIRLIAPDGSAVLLQQVSFDRTADVHATFGLDAGTFEPLETLHGRSARGTWLLEVADMRSLDAGTLDSWGLVIRFAGDAPRTTRPPPSHYRSVFPIVAHIAGAGGTRYETELRLVNSGILPTTATLVFTPSGANGRTDFAAVTVPMAPHQVLVFDDVVRTLFHASGSGTLEVLGPNVFSVIRIANVYAGGTVGARMLPEETIDFRPKVLLLENSDAFRSNVGFSDLSGHGATVTVDVWDARTGVKLSRETYHVPPYSQLQVPVRDRGELLYVEVTGSALISAYGSIIENATGDFRFAAVERVDSVPAISAPGANGTYWRTDLILTRVDEGASAFANLTFIDQESGERTIVRVPELELRRSARYDDVVATLFHRPGRSGVIELDLPPGVHASGRIGTGGTSRSIPLGRAVGGGWELLTIESSERFRTNIGLIAAVRSDVRVRIYDAAGNVLEDYSLNLTANRLVQLPVRAPVTNGRARIDVREGAVSAFTSLIDNVTGDV